MKRTNLLTEQVLALDPATRSNDRKLLIAVWRLEGLFLSPEQEKVLLERCSSAESITRNRRELQSVGLYPPAPKVQKYREQRFRDERMGRSLFGDSY